MANITPNYFMTKEETKTNNYEEYCPDEIEAMKVTLCILPTQSGKTFMTIGHIRNGLERDKRQGEEGLNIIFTMDTILGTEQFARRLETIENEYEGSVYIFNSKKTSGKCSKYKHVSNRTELLGKFAEYRAGLGTRPRVIVVCSNQTRFRDALEFIKVMDNLKFVDHIFIYCDELHQYIEKGYIRDQLEEMHNFDIVNGILAITATAEKITMDTGFWSKLKTLHLKDFDDSDYVGYRDLDFIPVNDFFEIPYVRPRGRGFGYRELEEQTIGNIFHILSRYPNILGENTRSFIPAHVRRTGHQRVRDMVFSLNSQTVVVVINGKEKSLTYTDLLTGIITVDLEKKGTFNEELSEKISRTLNENNLKSRPLVITGFLCVGMGQTLIHRTIGPFTSAVFGHLDLTNDDIYQLFGRITGRMKTWDTYVKTTVYCPNDVKLRCETMEKCVRNIIDNHNGKTITQDILIKPIQQEKATKENIRLRKNSVAPTVKKPKKDKSDFSYRLFDTLVETKAFILAQFGGRINERGESVPKTLSKDGTPRSVEYYINRQWGIGTDKNRYRAFPTDQNKWIVYWRSSIFNKPENEIKGDQAIQETKGEPIQPIQETKEESIQPIQETKEESIQPIQETKEESIQPIQETKEESIQPIQEIKGDQTGRVKRKYNREMIEGESKEDRARRLKAERLKRYRDEKQAKK
jgi:hypothetical protein